MFGAKIQKPDGAKVITWNWSGQPHQIWIAKSAMGKIGFLGGAFRLCTATHVIDDLKVLEQGLGLCKIMIWVGYPTSRLNRCFLFICTVNATFNKTVISRHQQSTMECFPSL